MTGLSVVTLFNLHAERIMRNARLDELQAEINIGGRNIKNLRYADDTTLMAESKEELKNLLMRVKEGSGKSGLKINIKKTKIMTSNTITLWQVEGKRVEASSSWGLKLLRTVTAAMKSEDNCLLAGKP